MSILRALFIKVYAINALENVVFDFFKFFFLLRIFKKWS